MSFKYVLIWLERERELKRQIQGHIKREGN